MPYNKKTWVSGETITKEALNNIENGIATLDENQSNFATKKELTEITKQVNINDFGAIGDGVTDNTDAFKRAIYDSEDGTTIIIPKGTYLVGNINDYDKAKKNITIKGQDNPVLKLIPYVTKTTELGTYTGSYTVQSYYHSIDFGTQCKLETIRLENGLTYYYFKLPSASVIPSWLTQDMSIRGADSNVEAYISFIDTKDPDGTGSARIYLYELTNHIDATLSFKKTGESILNERILVTPKINTNDYVIKFEDGNIPSFLQKNSKLVQSNGKSCRVGSTVTLGGTTFLTVNCFNTEINPFNRTNPLDDNLDFTVTKYDVGTSIFMTLHKWVNTHIEGITFDGANYEVAQFKYDLNEWNILTTGACENLTIRDCIFKNAIMCPLQITGVSNAYSPKDHDYATNVLIDNCTFLNNGRNDIEIIQGNTVNITNCEGNGTLDIECNNNEILNNINVTNCTFRATSPYSPGLSSSSGTINYYGCKFELVSNQEGASSFFTNCRIHSLEPYGCYCNLQGCQINKIGQSGYHGNEVLVIANSYVLGMYTTNPASKYGKEEITFNNVIFDLSISPKQIYNQKKFTWHNSKMISSTREKWADCTIMHDSTFNNVTFKNIVFQELSTGSNNIFRNCNFLLHNPTQTSMFAGNVRAKIYNSYIECNLVSTYGSLYVYDCILSNDKKPMISSWNKCHIHGLKDLNGVGISWNWTTAVNSSYPLTFDNVWLAENVPNFLGITSGNSAPSTSNVSANCSVFWVNSANKFMSKVIHSNGTLSLKDL